MLKTVAIAGGVTAAAWKFSDALTYLFTPSVVIPTGRASAIRNANIPMVWKTMQDTQTACSALTHCTFAIGGSAAVAALLGDDSWRGNGTVGSPRDIDVFVLRDDAAWKDDDVMRVANEICRSMGDTAILRQVVAAFGSARNDGTIRENHYDVLYQNPAFPGFTPVEAPLYTFSPAVKFVITVHHKHELVQLILCDDAKTWRSAEHLVTDFTDTRVACSLVSRGKDTTAVIAVPHSLSDSLLRDKTYIVGRKGDWDTWRQDKYKKRGFSFATPSAYTRADNAVTHHTIPIEVYHLQ